MAAGFGYKSFGKKLVNN